MNFVFSVALTSLNRLLSLIVGMVLSIILARTLGPYGQGVYSLIISFPMMITSLTNLGIGRSLIYNLGKNTADMNSIIKNSLFLLLVISFLSVMIAYFIIFIFTGIIFRGISYNYLLISPAFIPFYLLSIQFFDSIFLAFNRILEFNVLIFFRAISSLILILLFLFILKDKILGAVLGYLFSLLLLIILALILCKKETSPSSVDFSKSVIKKLVSFGVKSHISTIFATLLLKIDIYIINYFLNPLAVGLYVVSVNIAEKLWILSQSVATIFYPKAVYMKEEEKSLFTILVAKFTLIATFLGAFALFLLSEKVVLFLFSEGYKGSITPLRILLIGVIALSAERILANDINSRGKPMINTWITLLALISNILLNIVFIPKYGISGAAWATSISYVLNLLLKTIVFVKVTGISWQQLIFINKKERQKIVSLLGNFAAVVGGRK